VKARLARTTPAFGALPGSKEEDAMDKEAAKRFASKELADGRDSIDVIEALQEKGLTSREAEALVEEIEEAASPS
jgi:hypothetical protein